MREELLHYIWRYQRFNRFNFTTTSGLELRIAQPGQHNHNAGPDFLNAKIRVNDLVWAGHVEIHIKSSDWYTHKHHLDLNYDAVILHVVWENNREVYRTNGSIIECLELKNLVNHSIWINYKSLLASKDWVNCGQGFSEVDDTVLHNWITRLYFERLEAKTKRIKSLLKNSAYDWEYVLFVQLFRAFGTKVNAEAFESCARSIPLSIFRKHQHSITDLEALLMGQLSLLNESIDDRYYISLKNRYGFSKSKYGLLTEGVFPLKFARLRPANFPQLRIAQFAGLYHKNLNLFMALMNAKSRKDFKSILQSSPSEYWRSHYNFRSTHKRADHSSFSDEFVNLLLINAVIPIKYLYQLERGSLVLEDLSRLLEDLPMENNSIVKRFTQLKTVPKTALFSQGLVQLKKNYCDKNACLKCAVAQDILL